MKTFKQISTLLFVEDLENFSLIAFSIKNKMSFSKPKKCVCDLRGSVAHSSEGLTFSTTDAVPNFNGFFLIYKEHLMEFHQNLMSNFIMCA